jgi:hypothetical protein
MRNRSRTPAATAATIQIVLSSLAPTPFPLLVVPLMTNACPEKKNVRAVFPPGRSGGVAR